MLRVAGADLLLLRCLQEGKLFPEGFCYKKTRRLLSALNSFALPELAGKFSGAFEGRALFKKTLL